MTAGALLVSSFTLSHACERPKVDVKAAEIVRVNCMPTFLKNKNGKVPVSFIIEVPKRAFAHDEARVYTPILRNGDWEMELQPLKVEGRSYDIVKNDQAQFDRKDLDNTDYYSVDVMARPFPLEIPYDTDVDFDPRMMGAELWINAKTHSIQRSKSYVGESKDIKVIYMGVLDYSSFMSFDQRLILKSTSKPVSLVEDFGKQSVFIENTDELIGDNFYPKFDSFSALVARLADNGARFYNVKVAVSASPDGPLAKNEQLAIDRTAKIKELVKVNIPALESVNVEFETISENWDSYIEKIESTSSYTDAVRSIVEGEMDLDVRENKLYAQNGTSATKSIFVSLRNCTIELTYDLSKQLVNGKDCCKNPNVAKIGGSGVDMSAINSEYNKNKTSVAAQNNMMVALTLQGNYADAYDIANGISNENICPTVANNKGVLMGYMGDYAMARYLLEKPTAKSSSCCSSESAAKESASSCSKGSCSTGCGSVAAISKYNLAMAYLQMGDFANASNLFCDKYSANAVAANLGAGRYEKAAELTFATDPRNAEAIYMRALAYTFTLNTELVLFTLEQACNIDPIYKKYAKNQAEFMCLRDNKQFQAIVD